MPIEPLMSLDPIELLLIMVGRSLQAVCFRVLALQRFVKAMGYARVGR